ncbi:MAG: hypothetical protein V1739_10485 [Candidatus Omnitrophota bacterium]
MLSNKYLVNTGHNNIVVLKRIVSVVNADAACVKRLKGPVAGIIF